MKKRALLFGMANYIDSKSINANALPCTINDIDMLGKKLKQLQFEIDGCIDCDFKGMQKKLNQFAEEAPCDSLNILYFSGHGGHYIGKNYFYGVDFGKNLDNGQTIEDSALDISKLSSLFKREVKLLIIVDACRNNILPGYSCNFSEMVASKNTYIAYATQFEQKSLCNKEISYFTEALCENILQPNISIDQLFINVRSALYLKYSKQISNSVNGMLSYVSLNEKAVSDNVGKAVLQFVDTFGDMYVDKYGCFAGDDLVFIDAAQYCNISVLDAISTYLKLDAKRCHVTNSLSDSHQKLIAFWGMLGHGLKQDEFYTWQYRGRPIRLGEIPPLPRDMQRPMPEEGNEIEVYIKINIKTDIVELETNLPDKFVLYGQINRKESFSKIEVKNGKATIPIRDTAGKVHLIDLHSVLPTVTGVDMTVVGDKCRNLVGKYVKFNPINGNMVEYHYQGTDEK